jgi:hypothetical protein
MSVLPYLTHPLFLATLAGVVVPFIHWFLRYLGWDFSPKVNFLVNVALSGLAFLPLLTFFGNATDPETFWLAFGTSVASAQITYKMLVKGLEGAEVSGDAVPVDQPAE